MRVRAAIAVLAAMFVAMIGSGADAPSPGTVRMSNVPVEMGAAIIGIGEERTVEKDVAVYKAAKKEKKPKMGPGMPIGVISVGPLLDASDEAKVLKLDQADKKITITISYTSAKVRGASTSKGATPVALVPVIPDPGEWSVKIVWQCSDKAADPSKKPADIVQELSYTINEM